MATYEQKYNDAKKMFKKAMEMLKGATEKLNELEDKLERKEWGNEEELKELWAC
ncbi:2257_t:CDS:2 [Funneliformis caledonium]|uniref:2257_t:CDS:1 n=1 Tax=Funneliformis caledonium TaxID=1117310 RepID=A0A9N8YX66_9GLOM|nr:2257_t:CDS:2 [Funneliformis caledonium]